jgi:hypothetical protein
MTPIGFCVATLITIMILVIVRAFWEEILIISLACKAIGYLIFYSFISALLWAGFISQSAVGWGWLWLYFFIAYSGMVVVYCLIVMDIFDYAIDFMKSLFKR